jgi:hypothetical protein
MLAERPAGHETCPSNLVKYQPAPEHILIPDQRFLIPGYVRFQSTAAASSTSAKDAPIGSSPAYKKEKLQVPKSQLDQTLTKGRGSDSQIRIVADNSKIVVGGKTIPNIWLRDNCQCSTCMHETTKQRLQDTFAIPQDLTIKTASVSTGDSGVVNIEWDDGHKSTFPQRFLANATQDFNQRSITRQGLTSLKLWGSSIAQSQPIVTYQDATENGMGSVLNAIVSNPAAPPT